MAEPKAKTVLCVDDETTGLFVRKMILEMEGYRVLTAENGVDALKLFSSETIDLVVLDFRMPGMDGGEVAERMKATAPAIPILMLSAYLDLPSKTLALVDKYVTKGEPPATLLTAISDFLKPPQRAAEV